MEGIEYYYPSWILVDCRQAVLLAAKERKGVHVLRIQLVAVVEGGVCSDPNWTLYWLEEEPGVDLA
jgi:hypothetical protein